ncbi:membrane protein [Mycobacterium phage Guanica15]|uniref:Membrane protein n=1 Tax=Mycobacterium phage Yunkel11 TaxID=2599886 RepID=A0A5J6TBY9_9CAUD|nr:membrane protein [Mycobacterium phage Yunkel11]QFG08421.1 membrane protein [Mycobacterium phage Yunkel11]QFG09225.1 membrane protein [Mycobacterium phage Efra2]QFG11644.1 membrane protein [Mycobacterium phage Guanica15]
MSGIVDLLAELPPNTIAALVIGSPITGAAVAALLSRKRENFKALTEAYGTLIERVTGLETRVDTVETRLEAEKRGHEHTRGLLAIAMVFIRSVMNWGAGDRRGPMPVPPAELMASSETRE